MLRNYKQMMWWICEVKTGRPEFRNSILGKNSRISQNVGVNSICARGSMRVKTTFFDFSRIAQDHRRTVLISG
ncbi:MAG: hypothetical protein Q7R30_24035 [Acidobacteriota bacterium]|nr:hypothetical protein [Acidobacteriota bacterium]